MAKILTITNEQAEDRVNWLMNIGHREFWHLVPDDFPTSDLDENAIAKLREIARIARQVAKHYEDKNVPCPHRVLGESISEDNIRSIYCVKCEMDITPEVGNWNPNDYFYNIDRNQWVLLPKQNRNRKNISGIEGTLASDEDLEKLRQKLLQP